MGEIKTRQTDVDVYEFINSFVETEQKRKDSVELVKLMQDFTGFEARMWGPSIIGFGKYHYVSEKGTQRGEMPLIAFSPRKAAISLYVYSGKKEHDYLLADLGKFKMGKVCIYVKKLADININALKKLMHESINDTISTYGK